MNDKYSPEFLKVVSVVLKDMNENFNKDLMKTLTAPIFKKMNYSDVARRAFRITSIKKIYVCA